MTEYVAGFLFWGNDVWLIRKNKPDWQRGRINGIGGKIEFGETPLEAMIREFKEEAGVEIHLWNHYCTITDEKDWKVYFYHAHSGAELKTMTDEEVIKCDTRNLPPEVLPNLAWLIPMAMSFGVGEFARDFYVKYNYE